VAVLPVNVTASTCGWELRRARFVGLHRDGGLQVLVLEDLHRVAQVAGPLVDGQVRPRAGVERRPCRGNPLSKSRKLGTTTRPNGFSVLGLTTSSHCPLEPINHSPPTNSSSVINTASSPSSGSVVGPVYACTETGPASRDRADPSTAPRRPIAAAE
jgi:hypothetical protein